MHALSLPWKEPCLYIINDNHGYLKFQGASKCIAAFSLHCMIDMICYFVPAAAAIVEDVRIDYSDDTGYLVNTRTNSRPVIAHGNGPIKASSINTCIGIFIPVNEF